jgi:hypothetical protein
MQSRDNQMLMTDSSDVMWQHRRFPAPRTGHSGWVPGTAERIPLLRRLDFVITLCSSRRPRSVTTTGLGAPPGRFWHAGNQLEVSWYLHAYGSQWLPRRLLDTPDALADTPLLATCAPPLTESAGVQARRGEPRHVREAVFAAQAMPRPPSMDCTRTVAESTATAATLMVATILKARPFAASPRTLVRLARIRT